MGVKKLQKPTGQLLAAMQVNLYELYTTYLVNIFATLNKLNLKMQERNHVVIAFHSSNVFKVTLKLWLILFKKWCLFPHSVKFCRKTCSEF